MTEEKIPTEIRNMSRDALEVELVRLRQLWELTHVVELELLSERKQLLANLTSTQARCTELLEETRKLKTGTRPEGPLYFAGGLVDTWGHELKVVRTERDALRSSYENVRSVLAFEGETEDAYDLAVKRMAEAEGLEEERDALRADWAHLCSALGVEGDAYPATKTDALGRVAWLKVACEGRQGLRDILDMLHQQVADMCKFAEAEPDATQDSWTLRDCLVRLKAERDEARAEVERLTKDRDEALESVEKYYVKARVYGAIAAQFHNALRCFADRGEALALAALEWRHSERGGVPETALKAIERLLRAEKERDEAVAVLEKIGRRHPDAEEFVERRRAAPASVVGPAPVDVPERDSEIDRPEYAAARRERIEFDPDFAAAYREGLKDAAEVCEKWAAARVADDTTPREREVARHLASLVRSHA